MTTIHMDHVTKTMKGVTVINDISLTFHSGKATGLRGVNGSGKTMMMRLIAGLIFPTKGSIHIDDKKLGKDLTFPDSIGMLLENPAFLDSYSGFQNLKMLASIRNEIDDRQIRTVLTQVGLDEESSKKKYKKYSLGMKQRLGIAGAILEKPDIIILDEPTNSLDTNGVELVKQIVHLEKERGALVIISCHDTDILDELADEIHYLENGALISSTKGSESI
ncbi:ATP-binding cassette domain-containing protein [Gracilibacillus thailandensis]|uniref:ATP-binding cassette domain-containing protein n=1 Tax=Gracilibacillus thailandensis TaxID=563735 RepID=A0A6N7QXJ2_9BACI|nr:ABC transporter ATP-binding protein [Gracilibacillus thailandensis]MRI65882.1 ATP-binding cassette domain-containing protein [Gracilibacillus thailandensis]